MNTSWKPLRCSFSWNIAELSHRGCSEHHLRCSLASLIKYVLSPPLTCTENNVLHCQPNAYLLHYPHTVLESLPHQCIFLNLISAPLPISKYHLMHCCIFPPCLTWVQQRKMYSPWAPQPFFLFPSSSLYKSICH